MPNIPQKRKGPPLRQNRAKKSACTALMVVDQAPFLKKALSTCKRLRTELHKKQALLQDFEEQDRGAFQQWFNKTQGKKLSENRELREEAGAYEFILHHLSRCAYESFHDVPELYDELFERKKNGSLFSYVPPESEKAEPVKEAHDEEDWDWGEDFEDDLDDDSKRDFFDRMFGERGSGERRAAEARVGSAQKAEHDIRLKTSYRALAKRLHPDHSELEESIREKRWHEIQAAYQGGDLEGLLRVEAICDMDETGLSVELGLARLHDLAAYHKSHLIPLRNALSAAKRDIAFGFSKKGPTAQIKNEVTAELREEHVELKEMMNYFADSAQGILAHVEAQIREADARSARAAQQTERRQAKRAKQTKRSNSTHSPKASAASGQASAPPEPEQMNFF